MRKSAKHKLKNTIKIDIPGRGLESPDYIIIDGCAMLWHLHWDKQDSVRRYVNRSIGFIEKLMVSTNVLLIFDRYYDFSIKSCIREQRNAIKSSRKYQLTLHSPLPQRNVILTNAYNKTQLIRFICEELILKLCQQPTPKTLILTGADPIPKDITCGIVRSRE